MLLYFHAKLEELKLSPHEFFETAYQWRFGKLVMLNDDFAQYTLHGILPKYVVDYLHELQRNQS